MTQWWYSPTRSGVRASPPTEPSSGAEVHLDGRPFTVIGVMPPSFDPTASGEQLWVPQAFTPERKANHDQHHNIVVGLLKPGVPAFRAQAELIAVHTELNARYPSANLNGTVGVRPFGEAIVGDYRQRLFVTLGAVAFVLLIACRKRGEPPPRPRCGAREGACGARGTRRPARAHRAPTPYGERRARAGECAPGARARVRRDTRARRGRSSGNSTARRDAHRCRGAGIRDGHGARQLGRVWPRAVAPSVTDRMYRQRCSRADAGLAG